MRQIRQSVGLLVCAVVLTLGAVAGLGPALASPERASMRRCPVLVVRTSVAGGFGHLMMPRRVCP